METTYREWEKKPQAEVHSRSYGEGQGKKEKSVALGGVERRRLVQLIICLALFGVVFLGKGVFPEQMVTVRERVLETIHADADFQAAFSTLGYAIATGEPVGESLEVFWTGVFLGEEEGTLGRAVLVNGTTYQSQLDYLLMEEKDDQVVLVGNFDVVIPVAVTTQIDEEWAQEGTQEDVALVETVAAEEEAVPAIVYNEYTGEPLPEETTMNWYNLSILGVEETVSPVMAQMSSGYGWRIHPVDGDEKFHYGVDLAVDTGTLVGAFADGVVDYIGESDTYGMYLQIDHGGGVTTFYAHCSELLVQAGQSVTAGETVALSGATGNVTGAHLHFEIRVDGIYVNPLDYIETT